jgi:hypothetical protein
MPYSMARVFDGNDCALHKRVGRVGQYELQSLDYVFGARIAQAEDDNARQLAAARGKDISEVEIEREDNSVFCNRLGKDVTVRQAVQSLVAQMNGFVAGAAQPLDNALCDTHVG